jgi:hypothetical protein
MRLRHFQTPTCAEPDKSKNYRAQGLDVAEKATVSPYCSRNYVELTIRIRVVVRLNLRGESWPIQDFSSDLDHSHWAKSPILSVVS